MPDPKVCQACGEHSALELRGVCWWCDQAHKLGEDERTGEDANVEGRL